MIPTTVTSCPTTATASSSSNLSGSAGSGNSCSTGQLNQSPSSLMIGIASLILEGRAITEDEYQNHHPHMQIQSQLLQQAGRPYAADIDMPLYSTTNTANVNCSHLAGRQSPKPSTSRAAALSAAGSRVINITTNPHAAGYTSTTTTSPLLIDSYSSSSASSSAESTHQRWTQKLCQLRQASPATSLSYEQNVSVEAQSTAGEPELVALAINDPNTDRGGDFEIVRRVMLSRGTLPTGSGASSMSSTPGSASDNFLHSLQSLATTCLRGSSPVADSGIRYSSLSTSPLAPTAMAAVAPRYNYHRATPPRFQNPYSMDVFSSGGSSGSGVQSPKSAWSPSPLMGGAIAASSSSNSAGDRTSIKDKYMRPKTCRIPIPLATAATSSGVAIPSSPTGAAATATATVTATTTKVNSSTYPQQGPHCDQFLRKMGLAKGEAAEAEEHFCDMSYVNITCSRWRAYCLKMEAIIGRGESICIEVYLGPVGHKMLLEQWIITQKEKVPPPAMTMPSLCSAIRSQLYFSQISAWCDMIKKNDKSIYDTGRIIFPNPTGAAGDLVTSTASVTSSINSNNTSTTTTTVAGNNNTTTPGTSPSATSSTINQLATALLNCRPRLNLFYRIKQYDSTACFNSKPNVHNFPSVNISENLSISICLKSLPRINGGMPKIGAAMQTTVDGTNTMNTSITTTNGSTVGNNNSTTNNCSHQNHNNGITNTNGANDGIIDVINRPMQHTDTPRTSRPAVVAATEIGHAAVLEIAARAICDNLMLTSSFPPSAANTNADDADASTAPSSETTERHHKCKFFIDEDELAADEADGGHDGDDDGNNSDTNSFGGSEGASLCTNRSHREKQLMKYRKRMLRRDKKNRKTTPTNSNLNLANGNKPETEGAAEGSHQQPMEEGDEDQDGRQQQQQQEKQSLPFKKITTKRTSTQIEMISTGTQTSMTCCQQCGNEKTLICVKCDGNDGYNRQSDTACDSDEMDESLNSLSSSEIIQTPRNKAELLLQAIQRTPKANKTKSKVSTERSIANVIIMQNNNHLNAVAPGAVPAGAGAGCQVCKRQKTAHNFSGNMDEAADEAEQVSDEDDDGDGKGNEYDQMPNGNTDKKSTEESMEEEIFHTSTTLTPNFERCTLSNSSAHTLIKIRVAKPSDTNGTNESDETNGLTVDISNGTAVVTTPHKFKTPNTSVQQQQQKSTSFQQKQVTKPSLLQISCNYHHRNERDNDMQTATCSDETMSSPQHNTLLMRKNLPKVNLTPYFCNPSSILATSHSSPTPICSSPDESFSFDAVAINRASTAATAGAAQPQSLSINDTAIDTNNIPVQKSYSAPTLPNSPSLSPRFAKQAAIYKRRSRHLSDRSDRSSLGSDEQFSDEEVESGIYSPATSPMKSRLRLTATFGRMPLLGNLEESLFHKRLVPKVEVGGFKLLLGASGGFCPTQLTIPAASYFYELQGESLSTPYMSEIRLPRKGYSIPRFGTVQATLLNPMGTVVRMFVIPYDMRDMPPLHQTFIRQRILAEGTTDMNVNVNAIDESSSINCNSYNNNNNNNNNDDNNDDSNTKNTFNGDLDNKSDSGIPFNSFHDGADTIGKTNVNTTTTTNTTANTNNNNQCRLSPGSTSGQHGDGNPGHFISVEHMKRLRYSIHLKFQTSRSGRLSLHTDIRLLISRRTDCDTAAAHAKGGVLEAPNDLITYTVMPTNPKYSARQDTTNKI